MNLKRHLQLIVFFFFFFFRETRVEALCWVTDVAHITHSICMVFPVLSVQLCERNRFTDDMQVARPKAEWVCQVVRGNRNLLMASSVIWAPPLPPDYATDVGFQYDGNSVLMFVVPALGEERERERERERGRGRELVFMPLVHLFVYFVCLTFRLLVSWVACGLWGAVRVFLFMAYEPFCFFVYDIWAYLFFGLWHMKWP